MKPKTIVHLTKEEWLDQVNYPNRPRQEIIVEPKEEQTETPIAEEVEKAINGVDADEQQVISTKKGATKSTKKGK